VWCFSLQWTLLAQQDQDQTHARHDGCLLVLEAHQNEAFLPSKLLPIMMKESPNNDDWR
jgi:hypothetical protein